MAYGYLITNQGSTDGEYTYNDIENSGIHTADVETKLRDGFYQNLEASWKTELAKQGITVQSFTIKEVKVWTSARTDWVYAWIIPLYQTTFYRTSYSYKIDIVTDKPIHGESLTAAALMALKIVLESIIIVVIAYFAIQAIKDVLSGMTSKKTTYTVYDAQGNVIEQGERTEPSWEGILTAGVVAIAALVSVLAVYMMLSRKKEG